VDKQIEMLDNAIEARPSVIAVVTSTLTAPNQSAWLAAMRKTIAEKHPGIKIVDVKPSQEDQLLAFQQTQDLLKIRPDLKGIFAITTAALPRAAEAVKQMGLTGKIAVVGQTGARRPGRLPERRNRPVPDEHESGSSDPRVFLWL
jgi:ABC-type sugar transport system substrate-binding protein